MEEALQLVLLALQLKVRSAAMIPFIWILHYSVSDTRRWQVHVEAESGIAVDKPSLEELASQLDDPNAVTRKGGKSAVAIKLKKGIY